MAQQFIYTMQGLGKVHPPDKVVLRDIWLSFYYGAKIGVLGLNGAGKSSLLKIMAGVDPDFVGEARPADGIKIGYLAQEPELDPDKTVRENIEEGLAEIRDALKEFEEISAKFAEPMEPEEMDKLLEKQGAVQEIIEHADGWEIDRKIEIAMDALRCPPADWPVTNLSGGERRRVALCRILLSQPDMLILDEPTNHLDAESVAWLERHLADFPGTIVAVTHDRYFLDNVAGWILELDRGHGIPWEGNYSSWLEQKEERLRQEEKSESKRQRTLKRELEWIRMSPKARHAKGKARITQYEQLLSQEAEKRQETAEIVLPPAPRLGDLVVEAKHVKKGFDDKLLVEDLNFQLPKGGIVGVIGPNGAGKTTLFRMIMGQETPDAGELVIGETVQISYVDQVRDALDADATVWEEISEGRDVIDVGKREINSRSYVGSFGFKGSDQQKRVGMLSGGERNRVHLAKLLKSGGNLLMLDEQNPRGLRFQFERIRQQFEHLPHEQSSAVLTPAMRVFLESSTRLQLCDPTELARVEPGTWAQTQVAKLLTHLIEAMPLLNDALTAGYFAHSIIHSSSEAAPAELPPA